MSKQQDFQDPETLFNLGLQLHQQGEQQEAVRIFSKIAEHLPDVPEVHYNLGLALYETEQYDRAADAYRRAAELKPDDEDIFYNLGLAYKKGERFAEAEKAYLDALELAPYDVDICYNLGCCYRDAGEIDQARFIFGRLADEVPDHLPSLNNLAYLHHLAGEYDRARSVYEKILQLDPGHDSARFMHAALKGSPVDMPPQEYIRKLFDHYSDSFEENLIEDLEYNIYLDLRTRFDAIADKKVYRHGLDLGCGTGLAGEAFRTACRCLSGVDLSDKMLSQAAAKQVYDHLHADEIVDFLRRDETTYDLFIAADVLIYLGDLAVLFEAAGRRAAPGSLFCLSTEEYSAPGWTLQPNGRYAHHPDYVMETAGECGWRELLAAPVNTRREGDAWVRGTLFILERNGGRDR
jgi:predicted TPR repeat methyltransferase